MDSKLYDDVRKSAVVKPQGHTVVLDPTFTGTRLYTITTIARSEIYGGTRCVVVCDNFERAEEIVVNNEGDIWEYSYMLLVIEATTCNQLYGYLDGEAYWYMWQGGAEGKYVAIETPKEFRNTIGWGIG